MSSQASTPRQTCVSKVTTAEESACSAHLWCQRLLLGQSNFRSSAQEPELSGSNCSCIEIEIAGAVRNRSWVDICRPKVLCAWWKSRGRSYGQDSPRPVVRPRRSIKLLPQMNKKGFISGKGPVVALVSCNCSGVWYDLQGTVVRQDPSGNVDVAKD